ncbi:hypothetical protein MS3_00002065 [Schistosoma haematobium]|uniref:Reverse transcriptase domain-containing protein n=1 Tax=Schistosoma haematobium TaxID=6185 RepID=A0A922LYW9_SCHHA|nr:hypothetical protein MS3_00002065 [Schistosoma haematobium]KAH9596361.1 hypothetical protein MS3_00002065 [Schistosoma haematobium]
MWRNSNTSLLPEVCADEVIQKNDESSITKPSSSENKTPSKYKEGSKSSCDNHRGISLTNIASKTPASIIIGRLTKNYEVRIREDQSSFRPDRGCVDHIFTIRQVLEHRNAYQRPKMMVFVDLKAAFDSVDREVLWQCLSFKGIHQKCINLMKAPYSNTTSLLRAYGELSSAFAISSGVRQGCPLSPFLLDFIIDLVNLRHLWRRRDIHLSIKG